MVARNFIKDTLPFFKNTLINQPKIIRLPKRSKLDKKELEKAPIMIKRDDYGT